MTTQLPSVVTIKWLKERGVCGEQVELFGQVFPGGAEVTRANLFRAAATDLSLFWLIPYVIKSSNRQNFLKTTDPGWETYKRVEREGVGTDAEGKAWCDYQGGVAKALADALGLPAEEEVTP